MRTVRILILEDDLKTLSILLKKLSVLEDTFLASGTQFSVTVLSECTQVEEYPNKTEAKFDVVLLDRDCKIGGSFHCLDLMRYSPHMVIGISSVPSYNEELKAKGVTRIVNKDYQQLDQFADAVIEHVAQLLRSSE